MTVMDTLLFFADIKGKKGTEIKRRANEFLEKFDLADRKKNKNSRPLKRKSTKNTIYFYNFART
ncbi:MAG: hypothetical protein IIC75_08245 [Bacteroidetes bacterium]|nr:hypothetical protein [Bacteroidota bacterium]